MAAHARPRPGLGLLLAPLWIGACAPAPDLGSGSSEFALRDHYREALREAAPRPPVRPLRAAPNADALSRATALQLERDFERLPNPLILLYVFPHLSTDAEHSPIPGYVTSFALYERTPLRKASTLGLPSGSGPCRTHAPEESC